jgi:hypothetical protein
MSEKQINAGDIVHLNSGSPDLKVTAIKNGDISVEWRTERGRLEKLTLPAACFRRVE